MKDYFEVFMDIGIEYEDWGKKFLNRMRENGENPIDLENNVKLSEWMCR
jgi:hypothetical protein